MFHRISNTETKLEVFQIAMKQHIECWIELLKRTNSEGEIRVARAVFRPIPKHVTVLDLLCLSLMHYA